MAPTKSSFNKTLQAKYPYLKVISGSRDNSTLVCEFCNGKINIASRGQAAITDHLKSEKLKHKASKFDQIRCKLSERSRRSSSDETNNVSSESRWVEVIKYLKQQLRPISQISFLLVEYAFSIPGSSAEVERLFSIINDVWEDDKGQMSHETLEAHLNIIFNSDLECRDFYKSIRNNRRLLGQVQSSEKYRGSANQSQSSTPTTDPQPIAIDSD